MMNNRTCFQKSDVLWVVHRFSDAPYRIVECRFSSPAPKTASPDGANALAARWRAVSAGFVN